MANAFNRHYILWKFGIEPLVNKGLDQAIQFRECAKNGEALISAAEEGNLQQVRLLLEAGASTNSSDKRGQTALTKAARYKHAEVARLLLLAGARVDATDKHGWTALMYAARDGHAHVVRQLLRANARTDFLEEDGYTALMLAARNGQQQVVQELLQTATEIDFADIGGRTALMKAAWHGHTEVVKQLLQAGAQIDVAEQHGRTALMLAAFKGDIGAVEQLLMSGANIHLVNEEGDSALFVALQNNHKEVARQLVKAGADPHKDNSWRKCALTIIDDADFAAELCRLHSLSLPLNELEKFWIRAKSSHFTQQDLLKSLKSTHITSLPSFVIAHNLLLLAIRRHVLGLKEARTLGGTRDYLLKEVYLPVTKLQLSDAEKNLVSRVVTHAEEVGFIRDGHAVLVNIVGELRGEIRETQAQLQTTLLTLARNLCLLEERASALERWTKCATEEFEKLCAGNRQMLKDMQNMNASLNELHSLLRKHQRRSKIAGFMNLCLTMIPVVGGLVNGAAFGSLEVVTGVTLEQTTSVASVVGSQLLSLDLSNFRNAQMLTSDDFLNKLDPVIQERVYSVVQHSNFETLPNLQNEISSIICEIEEIDLDTAQADDEEAELRQRFNLLTSKLDMDTVNVQTAIEELQSKLRTSISNDIVQTSHVTKSVVDHADGSGRINLAAFLAAFSELKEMYLGPQERIIPEELRQRFHIAAAPNEKLLVLVAKPIKSRVQLSRCVQTTRR